MSAAGGVVLRCTRGRPEVALVHRPRHRDWSLPKGKLERGESFEAAALREVHEETGLRCELGAELASSRYTDRKRRSKLVRWWLMRALSDDGFVAGEEIDELRWVGVEEARALLSYPGDVALLDQALDRLGG